MTDELTFAEFAAGIEGLTRYHEKAVPKWLRDRWERCWPTSPYASDEEFVESNIAMYGFGSWFSHWGTATIGGEECFLVVCDTALEPVTLAETLQCGLTFVEPGESSDLLACFAPRFFVRRAVPSGGPIGA